jgi:hypothetical protein
VAVDEDLGFHEEEQPRQREEVGGDRNALTRLAVLLLGWRLSVLTLGWGRTVLRGGRRRSVLRLPVMRRGRPLTVLGLTVRRRRLPIRGLVLPRWLRSLGGIHVRPLVPRWQQANHAARIWTITLATEAANARVKKGTTDRNA